MTGITQNVGISIHAPAKGATARTGKDFFRYGYFNPRSREGSDVCRFSSLSRQNDFNPRSREGSDRARTNETRTSGHFNPRSREGSDRLIFRLKEIIQEFQSTLPRRERLKTVYLDRWCNRISIHAPAKGATRAGVGWWFACVYFNPRSREGSDHISVLCSDSLFRFQSTLPRRERPVRPFTPLSAHTFQSTLPRRERHGSPGPHRDEKNISIHAPAKGATQSYLTWQPSAEHFNPRSREGSDRGAPLTRRTRWHFNPRSREGSDCCMSPTFQRSKISIHAPAKGATQMAVPFLYRQRHFNPRSREGSDATSACAVYGMRYFNPRSREGSDISELHFPRNLLRISIHAPAKGATLSVTPAVVGSIFQSTLPRRERRGIVASVRAIRDFNPRSREGSDSNSALLPFWTRKAFQSTLPRRERRITSSFSSHRARFQSTLPRRERRVNGALVRGIRRFQSTLPRRERLHPRLCSRSITNFNPRSREGSDLALFQPALINRRFQSTLPRRERRPSINWISCNCQISIHAPAKGATRLP